MYTPHHDSPNEIPDVLVRSRWSDEDNAWLAEAVGIPGTRTHADTEARAREAAQELATEWTELKREAASLSLDEFARWMDLDIHQTQALRTADPDGNSRRSLQEWNRLWRQLKTRQDH